MEKAHEKHCRLCLIFVGDENFKLIEGSIREVFEHILSGLDLDEGRIHVLCNACYNKLFELYNFKTVCLQTENIVSPYVDSEKVLLRDLREIYVMEKGYEGVTNTLEDLKICRLCLQPEPCQFMRIEDDNKIYEFISKLQNFKVTTDPVICLKCYDSLYIYSNFMKHCFDNEMHKKDSVNNPYIKTEEVYIKCEDRRDEKDEARSTQCIKIKSEKPDHDSILPKAPIFRCDKCLFETKHKRYLKKHQLRHKDPSEVQIYKCDQCLYETIQKHRLIRHELVHKDKSEVPTFKCTECKFESKWKKDLSTHQLIHRNASEVQMYKCDECEYQAKCKDRLKHHKLQHRDPSELQMYKCDKCKFETRYRSSLLKHRLQHEPLTYKCQNCSLEKQQMPLKDSLEVQTFECDKCVKVTQQEDAFAVNLYKCDECGFETKFKQRLIIHRSKHKDSSDMQLYKCGKCDFESKFQQRFQLHQLRHKDSSEAQKFKCHKCTYETKIKQSLRLHLLRHKDSS